MTSVYLISYLIIGVIVTFVYIALMLYADRCLYKKKINEKSQSIWLFIIFGICCGCIWPLVLLAGGILLVLILFRLNLKKLFMKSKNGDL